MSKRFYLKHRNKYMGTKENLAVAAATRACTTVITHIQLLFFLLYPGDLDFLAKFWYFDLYISCSNLYINIMLCGGLFCFGKPLDTTCFGCKLAHLVNQRDFGKLLLRVLGKRHSMDLVCLYS